MFGGKYFNFLDDHTQALCHQWYRQITLEESKHIIETSNSSSNNIIDNGENDGHYSSISDRDHSAKNMVCVHLWLLLTFFIILNLTITTTQSPLYLEIIHSFQQNYLMLPHTVVLGMDHTSIGVWIDHYYHHPNCVTIIIITTITIFACLCSHGLLPRQPRSSIMHIRDAALFGRQQNSFRRQ